MKLCLVNTKKYLGREGSKNEGIPMVKLIFESEKGQFYAGSSPVELLSKTVSEMQQVETYDPAIARDLLVDINVWDGKKTENVIISRQ